MIKFSMFFLITVFALNSYSQKQNSLRDPRDNKNYKTVKIGSQTWMAENLNFSTKTGSWCFESKIQNCNKYGLLYNWATALTVCPSGWHLPTTTEFETLMTNSGEFESKISETLKDENENSFKALMGGWRGDNGFFYYMGNNAAFWSSTEANYTSAWNFNVFGDNEFADTSFDNKNFGYSVRCIKNE